ncbi:hypothetical protein [Ruminococcus sp.]|uniref:hypothetical protein n=1 Tax=Ruminococcus sp. TaxID=41978 RepID=UPI003F1162CF
MNVITYDVYKNTVKKHDGFNPVSSEKNYTKLQFRFRDDDDWKNCTLVTASFWLSNDNIVKSDVELLSDNLTATFDIPPEFSGIKGALKVGLQGKCGDDVIIATNIITLNRNNGVIVTEGANAELYEKIIDLVEKYFKDDKAIIDSFIESVKDALLEKADKAKTLAGYGITDGENNNNKITDKSKITDENLNYPSIAYLLEYYYDFEDINEFLEDKVNVNDFEKVSSAFIAVPSVNLFNPVNVINANIDGTNKVIVASPTSRLGYVKCEPNTVYSVVRNEPLSSRFFIGTANDEPLADTPVTIIKTDSSLTSLTFTTDSSANYIVFYFYIQKSDGEYNQSFAENIMIAEGEVSAFIPYEEKQILKENNLPPIVDKRLTNVENIISSTVVDNRFNTKSKIYGVTFNNSDTSSDCQRIGNAVGLKTDYVVGDDFQNGGKNDFDSIFPWCDIRRCNLTVDADGKKTITYEGEDGFALDGSNGNVMVEIPKFYSYREVINGEEIWVITGEPKSGFTVEPAFIGSDGKELDYIYVGAYQFSDTSSVNEHSKSGSFVQTGLKLAQYRTIANAVNMQCLDFAVLHALQMLFVIEFADRDTDKYMQGVSYLPWFSSSNSPIIAISDDRLTVTVSKVNRVANLRAEQNVMICQSTSKKQENLTITAIAENTDNTVSITLDTAISSNVDISSGNIYIAGQAQKAGLCDTLSYHTGRLSEENALSPFRYRWIENLWGNAWEILEGIRVKELKYYYTFNSAQYADISVDNWNVSQIIAPNQPYLGDDSKNRAWISKMGYDVNDRQIILPSACSTDGSTYKYYSSALYTQYDVDKSGTELDISTEYLCVFGGGYDHNALCGLFTMRFWFADGKESSSLHTSRLIYR